MKQLKSISPIGKGDTNAVLKNYRLFFLRECDMMEIHDGYCFCFGQPA